MSLRSSVGICILLLGVLGDSSIVRADPEVRLRVNPFLEPAAGRAAGTDRGRDSHEDEWRAELRGTLAAGDESVADLGGLVLSIGDEAHGYRLIEVREFSAVFQYDGEPIELEIQAPGSPMP